MSDDDNRMEVVDIYSMDEQVPSYVAYQQQVFESSTCGSDSFVSSYSMNMELVHDNGTSYTGYLKDVRVVFGVEAAASAQCTTPIESGISYSVLYYCFFCMIF